MWYACANNPNAYFSASVSLQDTEEKLQLAVP